MIVRNPNLWSNQPTAPRTKVIAWLAATIGCFFAAWFARENAQLAIPLVTAAAGCSIAAWRTFKAQGFAGD